MADDIHHADSTETDRSNDHQQALDACEHAADALHNGDLAYARTLLDEARAAVEHAQHDDSEQAHRETAYDCYG
jgi:hypothetical protein